MTKSKHVLRTDAVIMQQLVEFVEAHGPGTMKTVSEGVHIDPRRAPPLLRKLEFQGKLEVYKAIGRNNRYWDFYRIPGMKEAPKAAPSIMNGMSTLAGFREAILRARDERRDPFSIHEEEHVETAALGIA